MRPRSIATAAIAQLVEHFIRNEKVTGSSPVRGSKILQHHHAGGFFNSLWPRKRISGKFVGINYAMLPNCEWNQKQKHKKQPWSNVECFAFGGATVRFASLETSFHAANHTIPPPPSHEGYPLCPKDKNRSPFHGEKPLMIK